MISRIHLYGTRAPWLHALVADHATLTNLAWAAQSNAPSALNGQVVVRLVRGKKMRSFQDMYDEFAAALQFPLYFGENLAALDECLTDLEWLPGSGFILVVSDANEMLADEGNHAFEQMIALLADVAETWNTQGIDTGLGHRPPTPFHVLIHVTSGQEDVLSLIPSVALGPGPESL
jgi:RNAse (barnase) inhibitor barstar